MSGSNKMFYLLGGEKPSKKINLEKSDGNIHIDYMATRTKELMHVYENEKCIASFYRTLSAISVSDTTEAEEPSNKEVLKVAGSRWKEFRHYFGLGIPDEEQAENYLGFQQGRTKSLTMQKDMKYLVETQSTSHVLAKVGNSIEDYLYELRTLQIIAEEKGLDISWTEYKNYRLLIEDDDVLAFVNGLATTTELVGFDTETTGLLVGREKIDILVGISMSYQDDTGVYIPLQHRRLANVAMGQEALLELLKPHIDRHSPTAKPLVTHNGGFDWKTLKMYGIDLNIKKDTFIRQGLKAISEAKNVMKLKEIVKTVLGYDVVELSDMYAPRTKQDIRDVQVAVFEKGLHVNPITRYKLERAEDFKDLQFDFRFVDGEFARVYGAADADFPRLIHKIQDAAWDNSLDSIYQMEVDLIPVLGEQEYFGVRGVREAFERLLTETTITVADLQKQIHELVGEEFNIDSPQQKATILYEKLQCPVLPRFKTRNGGLKTDKATLNTLAEYKDDNGEAKYPVIPLIQKYTKQNTLIKNFYGKLPKLLHGGFFFPSYMQLGTETGRISCGKPNLQQTEPTSRSYMVPDTPDHYFLICDYSQVEYRIMAGMSGEKKVVDFFSENPEADYHILAYANMMGKAYEDVTAAERKVGKVLNFGTTYGLEDEALALALFGDCSDYHKKLASQKRDQYFAGVPVLRDYFERIRDEAQARGFVTTMYGRVRHIPEFNYEGHVPDYKIQSGRRKAGNMPVQGTAADIMKFAMIRVHRAIRKAGFTEEQIRLVMNIHDELVIQVHKSINMWYALAIVRKAMEIDLSAYGFPPLYIGANVGYTWKDGKVDHLEAPVLLMDEKIEEIRGMLQRGETLPTYDDPRQVWSDEISKFALRQVEKEIHENNLTTLAECYKNIRIMKYSRHFVAVRQVDGEEKEFSFDNNIITLLLDRNNTAETLWPQLDTLLATMPIVKFTQQAEQKVGRELPETTDALLAVLKQHIKYDRTSNILHLHLTHIDNAFLSIIDGMTISLREQWLYETAGDLRHVHVHIEGNTEPLDNNQRLIGKTMGFLVEVMKAHLFGGNYTQLQNEMQRMMETFKRNVEVG